MKRIWIVASALVGSLLVGEMVARFGLGLGDPPLYVVHPTIEYMYRPDQNVMRFGNQIIVNHYGMRSEDFPVKKSDKEFRVMIFGDSVVNGGSLTDQSELATTLLKNKLTKAHAKVVRVGNISAGQWGPGNWLAYAKEYGFFDADIVVLVMSSHDAFDNPTFEPLDPDLFPQSKPVSALWEGFARYLPRYLAHERMQIDSLETAAPQHRSDEVKELQRGMSDLKSFLRLAQAQTKHVLVAQYPERSEIAAESFKTGYSQIMQTAKESGAAVISIAPAFVTRISMGEQPYRDDIHPNVLGQAAIAETLYDQVLLFGMLEP